MTMGKREKKNWKKKGKKRKGNSHSHRKSEIFLSIKAPLSFKQVLGGGGGFIFLSKRGGCSHRPSDDEPSSHKPCQKIVEKGNHSMGDMLLESGRRVPRRPACMHARIKRHHEGASDVNFGFPMTDVAQFASTGQILRAQTYYRAVPRRARPVGSHSVCLGAFSIGGTRGRRATAPQSWPGPPSERADLAVPHR